MLKKQSWKDLKWCGMIERHAGMVQLPVIGWKGLKWRGMIKMTESHQTERWKDESSLQDLHASLRSGRGAVWNLQGTEK